MDNPLTPTKIRRLLNLAEDRSFTPRHILMNEEAIMQASRAANTLAKSTVTYESSSGLLDLDQIEAFGDSAIGNASLRSTAFNPGEMTGRSTGADDAPRGRHSIALNNITDQMNKQTNEVYNLMRNSISTEYCFQSNTHKINLTEEEASFIRHEAPLPVQTTNKSYTIENLAKNQNMSMSAYFEQRCEDFGKVLKKTDSPDRSTFSRPSISEVSSFTPLEPVRLANNNATFKKSEMNFPPLSDMFKAPKVPNAPLMTATSTPFVLPHSAAGASAYSENLKRGSSKPQTGGLNPSEMLKMRASMRLMSDNSEAEQSFSLSKIAECLGNDSNVRLSDQMYQMLQSKTRKAPQNKNCHRLPEVPEKLQEFMAPEFQVTNLRDSEKMDAASSAGTVNTVISLDKLRPNKDPTEVPTVVVTHHTNDDDYKSKRSTRSKSPSSKSQSTLSTVHENHTSFKSGDSPLHTSTGHANTSHVRSPNIVYRELDKSVDWRDVLYQKQQKQDGLAKEQWAEFSITTAQGFVGVNCPVTLTLTTLTETWITAEIQFENIPNNGKDLTIELPRLPLILSPGKSEQFIINITSNVEMDTTLPFTLYLKDASLDGDLEQKGAMDVRIKMPSIQVMSADGLNQLTFPSIQEQASCIKPFVIISNCPCDLQLHLSVEGDHFTIVNVQEIKKSDVNKVLIENAQSKGKYKGMNKQLCTLSCGNVMRVSIKFNAPKITAHENAQTFNGALNVYLFGVNTILKKVELIGNVGTVNFVVKSNASKLHLTNEVTSLTVCNTGTVPGAWFVKFMHNESLLFKVTPSQFDIRPGAMRVLSLSYRGPQDSVAETTVYFEDATTGSKTAIVLTGGTDKYKSFPIKTNHNIMSWVRPGLKELSLKNSTDRKVYIRCQIFGEGFAIDVPGVQPRDAYCVTFAPGECRSLPITFAPTTVAPLAATLHLANDKNNDFSRTVKLFGCSSGEPLSWHGLVSYGNMAIVQCASRDSIALRLYNKSHAPAFLSAQVHFSLQFTSIADSARLEGNNTIIGPRSRHTLQLAVDWPRVERAARAAGGAGGAGGGGGAGALAAVRALTGPETTRRRILRVLRDETTGELDSSLLDDRLKVLTGHFQREDPNMDSMLAEFTETKASLTELIGGLHELQVQIVQDFSDEHTIVITDDTCVEHHTLCD